jgi:dihydroorotase-like cyclic amidohydrolase
VDQYEARVSSILIENGAVVTVDDAGRVYSPGYVFLEDDRISAVGSGAPPDDLRRQADTIVDASHMAVMPGMVNAHTHLFQTFLRGLADDKPLLEWLKVAIWPVSQALTEHDAYIAALLGLVENIRGGATSVIDHQYVHTEAGNDDGVFRAAQETGVRFLLARGWADTNYHPAFMETPDRIISEMARLRAAWHGEAGGRLRLEFGPLIPWGCTADTMRRTYDLAWQWGVGTHIHVAEVAGCPLYIVHVSTQRGAAAVSRARARGQMAIGETCPQYLLLTDAEYDRPGFDGAKFVCSPPLRKAADNAALWAHLAADDLNTVGTDHCPFFYAGQKDLGTPDALSPFNRIPGGMPGIESRLALLYTFGVAQGRLSLARWIDVCCAAPGRVFGLAGRKGALAVGADADVVIFDPERDVTLSRSILHENCDYTPYEGYRHKGYPVLTMLRGRVIARDGEFVGGKGGGRFLVRETSGQVDK